jgi:hypothetical protein
MNQTISMSKGYAFPRLNRIEAQKYALNQKEFLKYGLLEGAEIKKILGTMTLADSPGRGFLPTHGPMDVAAMAGVLGRQTWADEFVAYVPKGERISGKEDFVDETAKTRLPARFLVDVIGATALLIIPKNLEEKSNRYIDVIPETIVPLRDFHWNPNTWTYGVMDPQTLMPRAVTVEQFIKSPHDDKRWVYAAGGKFCLRPVDRGSRDYVGANYRRRIGVGSLPTFSNATMLDTELKVLMDEAKKAQEEKEGCPQANAAGTNI